MEKVRQKEENGKEDVKETVSAEFLLCWGREGGNMSKLQILAFNKQVEMSFLFFFFFWSGFAKKVLL